VNADKDMPFSMEVIICHSCWCTQNPSCH